VENPVHFLRHKETGRVVGYDKDGALDYEWLEDLEDAGWELITVPQLNVVAMVEDYLANKNQLEMFEMDIVWRAK